MCEEGGGGREKDSVGKCPCFKIRKMSEANERRECDLWGSSKGDRG